MGNFIFSDGFDQNPAYDELPPIIVEIDGVPLSLMEYKQSISVKRAAVMSKYVSYGIETGMGFWETEYKNETPLDALKRVALGEAVRRKIIQIFARQKGVTTEITYKTFLQGYESENNRRTEALANNQVIYGPKKYEAAIFFDLHISNLSAETIKAIERESKYTDGKTADNEYEKTIAEMIQKANIKINHEIYDNISVDDIN